MFQCMDNTLRLRRDEFFREFYALHANAMTPDMDCIYYITVTRKRISIPKCRGRQNYDKENNGKHGLRVIIEYGMNVQRGKRVRLQTLPTIGNQDNTISNISKSSSRLR